MIEFLTRKGFAVAITRGLVLLTHKNRPGETWDYPSIKAAYLAWGGQKTNLQATGGRV